MVWTSQSRAGRIFFQKSWSTVKDQSNKPHLNNYVYFSHDVYFDQSCKEWKTTQHGNNVLNRFEVDYGHIRRGGHSSISRQVLIFCLFSLVRIHICPGQFKVEISIYNCEHYSIFLLILIYL